MSADLALTDFDRRLIALITAYEAARTAAYQAPDAQRALAEAEHRTARDQLGKFLVEVRTYRLDGIEYTARRVGKAGEIVIERMRLGKVPAYACVPAPRKPKRQARVETAAE